MLSPLLERATRIRSAEGRALAEDVVGGFDWNLYLDFVRESGWDFCRDFVRDLGADFVRDLVQSFGWKMAEDMAQYFVRGLFRDVRQNFARDFGWRLGRYFGQGFGRYLVRNFVQDLGRADPMPGTSWLLAFACLDTGSIVGRAAPRATLGYGEIPDKPVLALFRTACRTSFTPGDVSLLAATARACEAFDGDPLWPALARHVARISTPEDRALLEDLARHPEQRQPPLSWGLQHYVRGDLVFDDDSVVTLDELCAQAGLAPLPLLEPMPDELDIPLDDPSR